MKMLTNTDQSTLRTIWGVLIALTVVVSLLIVLASALG